MIIKNRIDFTIVDAPVTKQSKRVFQLMTSNHIYLQFNYPTFLKVEKGSYIEHEGQKFYVIRKQQPEEVSSANGYSYELYFDAVEYWLATRKIFYLGQGYKEATFSHTGEINLFAQLIIDNANSEFSDTWNFNISASVATRQEAINFEGISIFEACTKIAEAFETEWWVETVGTTHTINFGKLENGVPIDVYKGEIINNYPPRKSEESDYGTRFYFFGSTENLPSDYGLEYNQINNSIAESRLRLPTANQYIDAWENIDEADIVEQIVTFNAIKPVHDYQVYRVETSTIDYTDPAHPTVDLYYIVQVTDLLFAYVDQETPLELEITFDSGNLNGLTFRVDKYQAWGNNRLRLISINQGTESDPVMVPNATLAPAVGDHFVVTGIAPPNEKISEAENELLSTAQAYVANKLFDSDIYECSTNPIYCKANNINLPAGQRVVLQGDRFGEFGASTRVQGFEKLLYDNYQAVYTFGITAPFKRRKKYESEFDAVKSKVTIEKFTKTKNTSESKKSVAYLNQDVKLKADEAAISKALLLKANTLEVYTIEEVDFSLGSKADASAVYTKTAADTLLAAKATVTALNLKANTSDVNTALGTKADASDVYTKTAADTLLAAKATTAALAEKADADGATLTNADIRGRLVTGFDTIYTSNQGDATITLYPTSNNIKISPIGLEQCIFNAEIDLEKGVGIWTDGQQFTFIMLGDVCLTAKIFCSNGDFEVRVNGQETECTNAATGVLITASAHYAAGFTKHIRKATYFQGLLLFD